MNKLVYEEGEFIATCREPVTEVADLGSAQLIKGLLEAEDIVARIEPVGLVAGFPRAYRVLVDSRQAHRARWVLQPSDVTEGELAFLATGKLGGETDD